MLLRKISLKTDIKTVLFYCLGVMIAFLAGVIFTKLSLIEYIILSSGLAFFVLIYYKFEWGLGLLIASMFYEKSFTTGFSLTSIIILPILAIILVKIINKEKKIYLYKKTDGIVLFLFLWMSLSVFYAKDINAVRISLLTYFQLIITYFIIKSSIDDDVEFHNLLKAVAILGFGLIIITSLPVLTNPSYFINSETFSHKTRIIGSALNPNMFARKLVFMLPICIYLFIKKSKLFLVPIIIIAFLVFGTFSRAGMIGMFVVFGLSMVILNKFFKKGIIISSILILVFIGLFLSLNKGNKITERLEKRDGSVSTRMDMINAAIDMIIKNPILGVGLNNFTVNAHLFGDKPHIGRAAHNGYLDVFATLGVPGFLLLLSLLYLSWKKLKIKQESYKLDFDNRGLQNIILMAQFIKITFVAYLIMAIWGALTSNKLFWVLLSFCEIVFKISQKDKDTILIGEIKDSNM